MKRISALSLSLILFACSSVPEKKSNNRSQSLSPFPVTRYEFDNGLRLLVVEDHSSPTFAYQTWYNVGSRNENRGRTGLAHLFEHMMFKGTKIHPDGEFDRLLESAGAEGENAFTSRDYTAYIQELPSDLSKVDMITRLEADRMTNLMINQSSFDTEREVVQNERRYRNENSPDGLMDQELFSLAFNHHPYHWPIIGYQKDLAKMSVENASQFYQTHYRPNYATIVAVGDLQPEKIRDLVQKHYGGIARSNETEPKITSDPPQTQLKRKRLPLNIQVQKLLMGYHIPGFGHEDTAALEVIRSLLASGKSSRLHRALVETGIASSVEASDLENKDPSLLVIGVNLQKGKKASQAEAIVKKEVARLMKEKPTAEELERAKNKIRFEFYDGLDSNFEKAYFLGHYETIGGHFEKGFAHQEKAQAVTADDVLRVTNRYFQPKNLSIIEGVPK